MNHQVFLKGIKMNKKSIFKNLLAGIFAVFSVSAASAISGVNQIVPDNPGQFVYYKDSTFTRESYIGVVYYDDSTYGFRYFAPAVNDKKNSKPAMEMQVFITIDPSKDFLEFTGERVEPYPRSQEETDLINYIHDFAYEMFPRRKKIENLNSVTTVRQDYMQFGGEVNLQYNPIVPVFNLEKISTLDGTVVLKLVTAGQITSSDDTTFSGFKGIPSKITDSSHKFKAGKRIAENKISIENSDSSSTEFMIDAQWEQKTSVVWSLENCAVISNVAMNFKETPENLTLLRRIVLGAQNSYPLWELMKIDDSDKSNISVNQVFYNSESESFTYDFKKISELNEKSKNLFSMTVYAGAYSSAKQYFDKILSSFKIVK